ncbi:MAG TPA: GNAT family N-acetyltransferase [Vicinamibacterales bacterium]|nr:GNAT family N-acetyltransferase [Vicinamibacterales bacterium]
MLQSLPDAGAAWRRIVEASSRSALAHSPEWFSLIQRAYGHSPLYLQVDDGEGHTAVLPAFVVRRPFFGTVVTSMPFLDSGGPCGSSPAMRRMLVEHLVSEARRIGARAVELRCSERIEIPVAPSENKVNMSLPLPADPDRLWRQLEKQVRNQVRKAERSGLAIEFGGAEKLASFYEAFVVRMRELGSPVHAPEFLSAVLDAFGPRARVALVRKGGTTVGGLIALAFKDRVAVPWATSLREYFSLCPNMLLYWETLRAACREGFRRFEFGRSSRHSGTYQFKCQWGAQEEPLFWYTIPVAGAAAALPRQGPDASAPLLARAWQRLPLAVTRHLGPRIRRYLIQ